MTSNRHTRWKRASHALERIEPSLVPTVQWLARLDVQHIEEGQRFLELSVEAKATDIEMLRFSDHYTMSYLWVLESYKVLRTIDKCVRNDCSLLPAEVYQLIRETEHVFEKIQLDPARKQMASDSSIFSPVLNRESGIGWQVSPDVVITRRELSDAFLMLLERIQRSSPKTHTDAREEPRTGFLQAIKFVANQHTADTYKGVTVNLSRSGMCIIAFHQLKEGQQIKIAHGLNVSNPATVCWIKSLDKDIFKVGLQLVS